MEYVCIFVETGVYNTEYTIFFGREYEVYIIYSGSSMENIVCSGAHLVETFDIVYVQMPI